MSLKLRAEPERGAESLIEGSAGVNLALTGRLLYPSDDRVLRFLREGWFEYRELAMMSRLVRPGDCFVDIGAHCGLYSRLVSRRLGGSGTVIAVEPNPALHPFLKANLNVADVLTTQELTAGSVHLVGAAVAAESGEALLHTGEAGWTAYSSLQPTAGGQFSHAVSVATRPLESLVVETQPGGQIIIKLDTEGLEYEILRQAVPFLQTRDDIHLMIEFDENNQALGGHTTGDLRKLLIDAGFALAMFDPDSGMLIEHHSENALWGANLVATKAIDLLNERLGSIPEDVAQETDDFLQSGAVAQAIYRRSEQLAPALRAIKEATDTMAGIAASLEGRATPQPPPEESDTSADTRASLIAAMQDQLARLEGSARSVAQQLNTARETATTLNYGLAQIADRLADHAHVTAAVRAELNGEEEQSSPTVGSDRNTADVEAVLAASDRLGSEIGKLASTARWLALDGSASHRDNQDAEAAVARNAALLAELTLTVTRVASDMSASPEMLRKTEQAIADAKALPPVDQLTSLVNLASAETGKLRTAAVWLHERATRLHTDLDRHQSAIDTFGLLHAETIKAEKALRTARLDLAVLIAKATNLSASKGVPPVSNPLALEHSIKTALTSAASHLSYGRRLLGTTAPAAIPVGSDDHLSSELNRLGTVNRELLAEIHRLGLIADKAKRSQWLRLGNRLGADVTRQLDTIVTLIADIEQRAASSNDQPGAQA
jgi:FkbM family methyltransferase